MNKINILHLRSSGGFFGAEGVILNLAKELDDLGLNNYVVCLNNPKDPHIELVNEAKKIGIYAESVVSRGKLDLRTIFQIRALLKKYKIDVLHCHDYKTNLFGFFAAKGLNITLVTTNHLWTKATRALRFYEFLDGYLIRYFNKIIAVSEKIKKEIIERGVPEEKIVIIYNGIDLNSFSHNVDTQSLKKEFNLNGSGPIIGTVGRLSIEKGIIYLLYAAKEVLRNFPDARFLIVGEGPLRKELIGKVKELEIDENVIFTGMRRDMANIYSLFDFCVSSSLREGLPLVILEALAMKKAVIATDVGGISTIIKDGETGILLKPRDWQGLARAIINLINNRHKTNTLGERGQNLVRENFSAKTMAVQYKQVYEEVLKQ